jgi:hypothetical protein
VRSLAGARVESQLLRGDQGELTAADLKAWLEHVPDRAAVRAADVDGWLVNKLEAAWTLGDAP